MISRKLILSTEYSYIILGPRQCGKSTLMNQLSAPVPTWRVDLLNQKFWLKYTKDISRFREEALFQIHKNKVKLIIVDEIQKIPELLNEVHSLIEETSCKFWLSGSSARKLKRGGANLLAGRALFVRLFPYVYKEVIDLFSLEESLQLGTIPGVFEKSNLIKRKVLRTYCELYLKEEILAEGLVRKLTGFSRFLDVAAQSFGELLNFSKIGRDAELSARGVQGYFEILEDTLMGSLLHAWDQSVRYQLTTHPKFYFFDNGITCALLSRLSDPLDAPLRGRLFEQFIVNEVKAHLSYADSELRPYYYRTHSGQEVDLLLAKGKQPKVAIEIKSYSQINESMFESLKLVDEEYAGIKKYLVCTVDQPVLMHGVHVLSWKDFLINELPKL